ncbi:hypothetical protein [Litorilituus lipolyticus]|uniref:Exonuclease domain-containing protein n=1 Tax=Litorilituus lipolyticus TaxID=2491017 RepID=A0A502KVF7_9GAMM|nr:hypothetical protein [Litorilituus lipolyticus]TPH15750.1 hypothetical protein EPA86_09265 [Litorilituus lipolyticus]
MKFFDPTTRDTLTQQNSFFDEFIILDIEASSLGFTSYPIEVAITSSMGQSASYLIQPITIWQKQGEWDVYAEKYIHKISQEMLITNGENVISVARNLNKMFRGKLLFCGNLEYDGIWLCKLFQAANVGVEFHLTDLTYLLESWGASKTEQFWNIYNNITNSQPHRALPDTKRFVDAYTKLIEL